MLLDLMVITHWNIDSTYAISTKYIATDYETDGANSISGANAGSSDPSSSLRFAI